VILECRGVTKTFGALRAVDGVDLAVQEGEILGLIGPNGAGKSTLFNIIAGVVAPTAGKVLLRGEDITHLRPSARCRKGVAKTFQVPAPFVGLTVEDNLLVAALYGAGLPRAQAVRRCREILQLVGLWSRRDTLAGEISLAEQRRLDLARALATGADVILLDESLAGLTPAEVEASIQLLQQVRAQGKTLLMVEHLMRAIVGLADRVVVLSQGRKIAEGEPEAVMKEPGVIEGYLGAAPDA